MYDGYIYDHVSAIYKHLTHTCFFPNPIEIYKKEKKKKKKEPMILRTWDPLFPMWCSFLFTVFVNEWKRNRIE